MCPCRCFGDSYYATTDIIALGMGTSYDTEEFRNKLAEGLRFFAAHESLYAVHCQEGRDRTGVVAALLECFMGAGYDEENRGRPIVLFGYSQGADHVFRLLEEYFGDEKLYSQLIAAYTIGWGWSYEAAERFPQIVPATGEDDIGCVISYDAEAPEVEDTIVTPRGERHFAINPLSWNTFAPMTLPARHARTSCPMSWVPYGPCPGDWPNTPVG